MSNRFKTTLLLALPTILLVTCRLNALIDQPQDETMS